MKEVNSSSAYIHSIVLTNIYQKNRGFIIIHLLLITDFQQEKLTWREYSAHF